MINYILFSLFNLDFFQQCHTWIDRYFEIYNYNAISNLRYSFVRNYSISFQWYYEFKPCLYKFVFEYTNYKLSINIIIELLLNNSYYLQPMIENEISPFPHTKKLFGSFCWFTLGHDIVNKFIFCFNMACGTVCYIFVSRLKTDLVSCIKNSRP